MNIEGLVLHLPSEGLGHGTNNDGSIKVTVPPLDRTLCCGQCGLNGYQEFMPYCSGGFGSPYPTVLNVEYTNDVIGVETGKAIAQSVIPTACAMHRLQEYLKQRRVK